MALDMTGCIAGADHSHEQAMNAQNWPTTATLRCSQIFWIGFSNSCPRAMKRWV